MAPKDGTTSIPPKLKLVVTLPHNHSTLVQWHPAMAPRPLPQSPHHSTIQWHPAMAPKDGTRSTPPKLKLVVTLPPNHSTLQWYPTMAPSNGTTSTAPCNGTLVPRPIRQSGSSPSPLLDVRTPIAIAIWGKIWFNDPEIRNNDHPSSVFHLSSFRHTIEASKIHRSTMHLTWEEWAQNQVSLPFFHGLSSKIMPIII